MERSADKREGTVARTDRSGEGAVRSAGTHAVQRVSEHLSFLRIAGALGAERPPYDTDCAAVPTRTMAPGLHPPGSMSTSRRRRSRIVSFSRPGTVPASSHGSIVRIADRGAHPPLFPMTSGAISPRAAPFGAVPAEWRVGGTHAMRIGDAVTVSRARGLANGCRPSPSVNAAGYAASGLREPRTTTVAPIPWSSADGWGRPPAVA